MIKELKNGPRSGSVRVPSSKSYAHRLLICAALGEHDAILKINGFSRDLESTADCLRALGAVVSVCPGSQILVKPVREIPPERVTLPCGESASTLRFLLPTTGALGASARLLREGRLPARPLAPLDRLLCEHGMRLSSERDVLCCSGALTPGRYELPGNVSSQFVTGLLLALPLLSGESVISVTEPVESAPYLGITEDVLRLAGIRFEKRGWQYRIPGHQRPKLPDLVQVEGDWSGAAFFLCMGTFSDVGLRVAGLRRDSRQGDRMILEYLRRFGAQVELREDGAIVRRGDLKGCTVDASAVPDLVPALSVLASVAEGETLFSHAGRLRWKESDRLRSISAMLRALGVEIQETPETLRIRGRGGLLPGGAVESEGDHRIAMAAAVAACASTAPIRLRDPVCVGKSYPGFWEQWDALEVE